MPVNNSNLTQRIRQALYSLKRQYGAQIDIFKHAGTTTDVRTGVKTISKSRVRVPRGIVMPVKRDRAVMQGISAISANKEFVMGGTFDVGVRTFILDRRDCPAITSLTADDWLVYRGKKYQIKDVETDEVEASWIINARVLEGETFDADYDVSAVADSSLSAGDSATAEVE